MTLPRHQVSTKPALSLSTLAGQERGNIVKDSWIKIWRHHSLITIMSKTDSRNELNLLPMESNQSRIMRSKSKSYRCFLPPLPSSWAKLHSLFSLSLSSQNQREMGNRGCSLFITCPATCSPSVGQVLTLFPCSSTGSLPWETLLHKWLQYAAFPRADP